MGMAIDWGAVNIPHDVCPQPFWRAFQPQTSPVHSGILTRGFAPSAPSPLRPGAGPAAWASLSCRFTSTHLLSIMCLAWAFRNQLTAPACPPFPICPQMASSSKQQPSKPPACQAYPPFVHPVPAMRLWVKTHGIPFWGR